MLKGWLIYSKKDIGINRAYIDWFITEAALQSIELELIHRENLTIGVLNNKHTVLLNKTHPVLPDFAVVRTIDPMLSLHLETCGVVVCNNARIATICNHKALTHHYVHSLGIPMVDTVYCKKLDLPANPPFPYPFVMKEVGGRGGQQVYFIKNDQEYAAYKKSLPTTDFVLQSSQVWHGQDVRVFVIGKHIIAAVLRKSHTDFRANYKLGGSASLYHLTKKEYRMVQKIVDHFPFDMVGIDFLVGLNGELLFNEIEDVVGSRTLSAVSDINLLCLYVKHINEQLMNRQGL